MIRRLSICILMAAAAGSAADNRDVQELQRDVAQLQEMIKNLQSGLDQRFSKVGTEIEGIGQSVDKVNASVAALQKNLDQVAQIQPALATEGTRIDQATASLNTLQQAMADLTSAVNKIQAQMLDVGNAVKVLSAPAPPPPGETKVPAADLMNNAEGDRMGGKLDLALKEYADYLKWYGDSPMAHIAQFQIGMLHYSLKDYDDAVNDFDALDQKYPDSTKVPDALFYKRKSLQAMGRNTDAAAACQELRKRFPSNDLARQCVTARR